MRQTPAVRNMRGSRKRKGCKEGLVDDVVELDLHAGVIPAIGGAIVHLPEVDNGIAIGINRIAVRKHLEAGTTVGVGGSANFDITVWRGARAADGGPPIDDRHAEAAGGLLVLKVIADLHELGGLHLGGHLEHARVVRRSLADGRCEGAVGVARSVAISVTDVAVPVTVEIEAARGGAEVEAAGGGDQSEDDEDGEQDGFEGLGHGLSSPPVWRWMEKGE